MSETKKLLLVDDEPGVRESVKAYLEDSEEFVVIVASNATQAWELLQQQIPDLIISDVMMPQVDGYKFLAQLREDTRFASLPVIFLTAKGMTSDRIQGYHAGCDAYLSKPFDPEELESIIKTIVMNKKESIQIILKNYLLLQKIRKNLLNRYITSLNRSLKLYLTDQEQTIVKKIIEGIKTTEIAYTLNVTKRNIEKHITRLLNKTHTKNIEELKSLPWKTMLDLKRANDGNRTRE